MNLKKDFQEIIDIYNMEMWVCPKYPTCKVISPLSIHKHDECPEHGLGIQHCTQRAYELFRHLVERVRESEELSTLHDVLNYFSWYDHEMVFDEVGRRYNKLFDKVKEEK